MRSMPSPGVVSGTSAENSNKTGESSITKATLWRLALCGA